MESQFSAHGADSDEGKSAAEGTRPDSISQADIAVSWHACPMFWNVVYKAQKIFFNKELVTCHIPLSKSKEAKETPYSAIVKFN